MEDKMTLEITHTVEQAFEKSACNNGRVCLGGGVGVGGWGVS